MMSTLKRVYIQAYMNFESFPSITKHARILFFGDD